jgi:hypothetical protein
MGLFVSKFEPVNYVFKTRLPERDRGLHMFHYAPLDFLEERGEVVIEKAS